MAINLPLQFPLLKEDKLLQKFEEIHNYIYANDGLSAQQTLEEFVKILVSKIFSETSNINLFLIAEQEWQNLNKGQIVLSFEQRITNLFEETKQAYPELFTADDNIRLSLITLGFIVNKLQNISLLNSSQDVKGLAFQKFLSHREKDGRGQFFTPQPVIDFCVAMLQPQPHETIIDPACGSGGFLISALKYLQNNFPDADIQKIITNNLYGLDINKTIARIAKMQILLQANAKVNIFCVNSLDSIDNLLPTNHQKFDIVLSNPPFGTGGKITNDQILKQFDLGYKWLKNGKQYHQAQTLIKGQPAEILFIERSLQLLKEGGRMGIVLPNGHFENPSLEYLRYYLKQQAKILAIVNLPQETFIPFGTGVKTSLLFLQKETINQHQSYQIFFGKIKKLGYQGNKNGTPLYQKDNYGQIITDSRGQPILDEDFSLVTRDYQTFLQQNTIKTANSFNLDVNKINGRFDYDFYAPENRDLGLDSSYKTVKLGDICEIVKAKSHKLKQTNFTVEYVELSDINTYACEIINTTTYEVYQLPSRASYEIQTNDIITAIAGNSVGTKKHATALVTPEFHNCICSNGFRVLRNLKIDLYFILYFLKSEPFLRQMFMYRTGAAIPNVSDTDLANIIIYLPNDHIINQISQKMQHAFELRQAAKKEFESIDLFHRFNRK